MITDHTCSEDDAKAGKLVMEEEDTSKKSPRFGNSCTVRKEGLTLLKGHWNWVPICPVATEHDGGEWLVSCKDKLCANGKNFF